MFSAVKADANGYLFKTIAPEALIKSLDLIMLGEIVLPTQFVKYLCDNAGHNAGHSGDRNGVDAEKGDIHALPAPISSSLAAIEGRSPTLLSGREASVLRCLMFGESNKLIARKYNIAEATVKVHVKAILRKIRVNNRTQAAIWAANQHWSHSDNSGNVVSRDELHFHEHDGKESPLK